MPITLEQASGGAGEPDVADALFRPRRRSPETRRKRVSQKRLSMRRIRELLRLKHELGRSHREIAGSLGIANSTVSDYDFEADDLVAHGGDELGPVGAAGVFGADV